MNPSGKLAETFPLSPSDCASHEHFASHPRSLVYREGLHVGYRHFLTRRVPTLFPFGHGLSYSTFAYGDLQLSAPSVLIDDPSSKEPIVSLTLSVANTGSCDGAEVRRILHTQRCTVLHCVLYCTVLYRAAP